MEKLDLKQKVLGIVYIFSFLSLFTGMFAMLSDLIYVQTDNDFYTFFHTFNWVALGFTLVTICLIIYNFFAVNKLDLLEIILYAGFIITLIVFLILGKSTFEPNYDTYASIYASYLSIMMQLLAVVVLLAGSKIALICLKRKELKSTSEVESVE